MIDKGAVTAHVAALLAPTIVDMYQRGLSVKRIAKAVELSEGQVEQVLGLSDVR